MAQGTAGAADGQTLSFGQTARAREIVGLALANFLLSLVTLSIYRFWARTRVRRYLWRKTRINGEPLEYTGRGSELFVSFVLASVFFIAPWSGASLYAAYGLAPGDPLQLVLFAAIWILLFLFLGYAVYRARAYILSRTRWRGIRFGVSGSGIVYALLMLLYALVSMFTAGLFVPFMNARLVGRMRRNTWIGDRRFGFDGTGWGLLLPYVLTLVIYLVVVGGAVAGLFAYLSAIGMNLPDAAGQLRLGQMPSEEGAMVLLLLAGGTYLMLFLGLAVWVFYAAYELNYMARHTTLDGVRFRLKAGGLSLLWLFVGNMLIIVLTLTIGLPFAQVRTMRYFFHRLEADGTLDIDAIAQSGQRAPHFGEGLADALDVLPV